mgnify:FL=1
MMPDAFTRVEEYAFVRRLLCGCVVGVTIQDDATLHYVDTVARWKRNPKHTIERLTVEQSRNELTRTFECHPKIKGKRSWKKCLRTP